MVSVRHEEAKRLRTFSIRDLAGEQRLTVTISVVAGDPEREQSEKLFRVLAADVFARLEEWERG